MPNGDHTFTILPENKEYKAEACFARLKDVDNKGYTGIDLYFTTPLIEKEYIDRFIEKLQTFYDLEYDYPKVHVPLTGKYHDDLVILKILRKVIEDSKGGDHYEQRLIKHYVNQDSKYKCEFKRYLDIHNRFWKSEFEQVPNWGLCTGHDFFKEVKLMTWKECVNNTFGKGFSTNERFNLVEGADF